MKLNFLFYAIFSICIFLLSLIFFEYYEYGDQIAYRNLYSNLIGADLDEVAFFQLTNTGSGEPLYGLIAWLGAELMSIDKDIYFSIINTIFCCAMLRFLRKNSASALYIGLIFINYYMLVLLVPAERLKVSFVFLMLALNTRVRVIKYALFSGAVFSHFQTLILLGAKLIGMFPKYIINEKKATLKVLSIIIIALVMGFYLIDIFEKIEYALIMKLSLTIKDNSLTSVINIAALSVIGVFVINKKFEAVLSFFLCGLAAYIVGPGRVNMIAFVIFSYYVITENRTRHPLVIGLMVYFAIKGIFFASDVFMYGTGFE